MILIIFSQESREGWRETGREEREIAIHVIWEHLTRYLSGK